MRTPNNYLPTAVLGLLFIGALHSCASDEKPLTQEAPVQLTVLYPGGEIFGVKVGTIHPFDFADSVLAVAEPSSGDTAVVVLDLSEPTLAYLEVADRAHQIYLTPGDDLTIQVRDTGENQTIFHTGTGSAVNNYLVQAARIEQKFANTGGRYAWELGPNEIDHRLDSTKEAYANFHRYYTDSVAISDELSNALQMRNRLKLIGLKENYQLVHYSDKPDVSSGVGRFSPEQTDQTYYDMPTDTSFLNNSLLAYDYAMVLKMHLNHSVTWPLYDSLSKEAQDDIPSMVNQAIRSKKYPPEVEQFLVAYNVSDLLASQGITPILDSLFTDFKQAYPSSDLTGRLETQYQQWLALASGRPAPPITGTTPEGEPLSLGDLKGKVVYLDVWATWCGPCLQEFPHSRKLQQQFEDNDQVAFLYISIDRVEQQERWKKMIGDQELQGVHIIDPPEGEDGSIMKTYQISGIPRYILIDQDGNMVDAEADRPSSGKVEAEINKLIAREG